MKVRYFKEIKLTVNGNTKHLLIDTNKTLARVLREDLNLTGTKINCEQGECGACTVIVDEKAVNSCLVLAVTLDGHSVTTIEGLGNSEHLDPLQKAFIKVDALQCGFCTPGMIMSAKALLMMNPNPGIEEIKKSLAGNYCRCTGYKKIIDAVRLAARIIESQGEV